MRLRFRRQFTLRWKSSCCILFGFEWMNTDDYERAFWRRFHVTIFGIDIWLEGKKRYIETQWDPEALRKAKEEKRPPVIFNLIKDFV